MLAISRTIMKALFISWILFLSICVTSFPLKDSLYDLDPYQDNLQQFKELNIDKIEFSRRSSDDFLSPTEYFLRCLRKKRPQDQSLSQNKTIPINDTPEAYRFCLTSLNLFFSDLKWNRFK